MFLKVPNINLLVLKFNLEVFQSTIYPHSLSLRLTISFNFLNYPYQLTIFDVFEDLLVLQLFFIRDYQFNFLNLLLFSRDLIFQTLRLQHSFLVHPLQSFTQSYLNHLIFIDQVLLFVFLIFNFQTLTN